MSETTNMVESLPKILSIIVIYKLKIIQQHQSTHIKKEKKYSIFALPVVICALGNTVCKVGKQKLTFFAEEGGRKENS